MNLSDSAILFLTTIAATVVAALAVSYFNKRRLFVVVPKLFPHSNLGTSARTAEVTIFNKGYRTEEDVRIEIDGSLSYELIASTQPTARIENSVIRIDRLVGGDEVTILLHVERGNFTKNQIASFSSKDCKGVAVEKVEHVPPRFGDLAQALFALAVVAAFFGFVGWTAKDFFDDELLPSQELDRNEIVIPPALIDLGWRNMESFVSAKFYKEFEGKGFPISIVSSNLKGQIATVKFSAKNEGVERLVIDAKLNSAAGSEIGVHANFGEHFAHDILILPGKSKEVTLRVDLPRNADPQLVWLQVSMTYGDLASDVVYNLEKDFDFTLSR